MTSLAQEAKQISENLDGVFSAFTSSAIGSDDYKDKAAVMHQNLRALAQLHPHWSPEGKRILDWHKDNVPRLDDYDPFILIYEYTEDLVRAWRDMRVVQPNISGLIRGGEVFKATLENLYREACDLTNRKALKPPTPAPMHASEPV